MAIYQGLKSELMKSQRVYLPNDIIFEFDDNKPNRVRMKTGKLHTYEIYRRLPYVSAMCECHDYGKGFVTNVGNNKDQEFIVTHNLDSNHIIVQIYDNKTNVLNETEINYIDNNSIKVIFNNIPDNEQYKVLVYSTKYYTDPYIGNETDLNYEIEHGIGQSDIVTSVLNTDSNEYEFTQVRNIDMSDDKVEISFNENIKNNQYLIAMEAGNYSQTITLYENSENKTFTINHNLDCNDIIVQIYNLTSRRKVYSYAQVEIIDKSNIKITFLGFKPEDFKDKCRMRVVLLDVRDVKCCYNIEKNKIHTVQQTKNDIPVILDWSSNTNYIIGELVRHEGTIYKCTTNNANSRFNLDCWAEVNYYDITNAARFDNTKNYKVGMEVVYENKVYRCINDCNDPVFNLDNWEELKDAVIGDLSKINEWDSAIHYLVGDLVKHNDKIYECFKDNINSVFSLDYFVEANEDDLNIKEID